MRDILFRGKRIDNGKWVFGQLIKTYFNGKIEYGIQSKDVLYEMLSIYSVIEDTIGQYTGRKDKNGVEIYEGDVNQDNAKVVWNNDEAAFNWDYAEMELSGMSEEESWCEINTNVIQ